MDAREALFAVLTRTSEPERSEAAASLRERRSRLNWTNGVGDAARFESNAILAGSIVAHVTRSGAVEWLKTYARGKSSIVLANDPLIQELHFETELRTAFPDMHILRSTAVGDFDASRFNGAGAGVTVALAGIADSGAIVSRVSPDENRSVSLLPDEHVAFLPVECIVPSLHAAVPLLDRLTLAEKVSAVTLIGGPSKTADIEKVLVTGVHGPGALTIVLIGPE